MIFREFSLSRPARGQRFRQEEFHRAWIEPAKADITFLLKYVQDLRGFQQGEYVKKKGVTT